ncbi:MAG: 2-C-methyl-D-erythritol 4-phosphate cytidylyltransferase [Clostridia bacterium]|nr:2-C-methyl-D-erythritol 4-phosphate cytidylyltransferase [Clostridia bacterium]
MNATEFKLEFSASCEEKQGIPVVIVAAGSSSRMKGIDKQFATLLGIPLLARTLTAFEKSQYISSIVVVTQKNKIEDIKHLAEKYMISKLYNVVQGGDCREQSVEKGLAALPENTKKALVHDGARPLVSQEIIKNTVIALEGNDCVACGVKVKDTIKKVDEDGYCIETVDRKNLISIQTPQGVNVAKFLEIATKTDLNQFTDDTSVMEFAGIKTKLVDGDYKNIKVTTPEDITLATAYLEGEF